MRRLFLAGCLLLACVGCNPTKGKAWFAANGAKNEGSVAAPLCVIR